MSDTITSREPVAEPGVADVLDAMARATREARAYHQVKAEGEAELARVSAAIEARIEIARQRYSRAVAELQSIQADQEVA